MNSSHLINAHRIDSNIFMTGVFYSGITIYNQQIRTLNLIYLLHKKGILGKEKKIVIVGGGISGVTAAMALSRLKYSVVLLEKKGVLMHLQHGCVIRKVHPNLYDWPANYSLKNYTELPFLNWKYNDASIVERILFKEFDKERSKSSDLDVYYNVQPVQAAKQLVKKSSPYDYVEFDHSEKKGEIIKFSCLIVATGFGIEQYVGKREQTKSYWRNEDYAQLRLRDQTSQFFISGMGDGGITDACRLAVINYDPLQWARNFESIKKIVDGKTLFQNLKELFDLQPKKLSVHFEKIYNSFTNSIQRLLNISKRDDIKKVIINGNPSSIEEAVDNGNSSFLNAWMIFILYKQGLVKYFPGKFPEKCGDYIFTKTDKEDYQIIVRHGTDKGLDLNTIHPNVQNNLDKLKKLQADDNLNKYSVKPQWELNEWSDSRINFSQLSNKLNLVTQVFLKMVSSRIRSYLDNKTDKSRVAYRLTLHRLVSYNEDYYFQQISPYFPLSQRSEVEEGRLFPISKGIVGYAMRTLNTIWLVPAENEKEDLKKGLFKVDEIHARRISLNKKQFLVIPVGDKKSSIGLLCFFLDITSSDPELLNDVNLREEIYRQLAGFTEFLVNSNDSREYISDELLRKYEIDEDNIANFNSINILNSEINDFFATKNLTMDLEKLVDVFDDEKSI